MWVMIVGDNAVGKTLYLSKLSLSMQRSANNLGIGSYTDFGYNQDLISRLYVKEHHGKYMLYDMGKQLSEEFNKLVDMLLRDVDVFILDEIGVGLSSTELLLIYEMLDVIKLTKNIIMVSHDTMLLHRVDKYCVLRDDELVEVTVGEAETELVGDYAFT